MLSGLAGPGAKLSILSDRQLPVLILSLPPPKPRRCDKRGAENGKMEEEGTGVCVAPEIAPPAFTHLPR